MNRMNKDLEAKLWKTADALRGNIASENYMHIVIGIMFLKHMSDNFDKKIKKYELETGEKIDREDRDSLADADLSFIIPNKARWDYIAKFATETNIGEVLDNAFEEIESKNNELEGLFEKNYNREEIDQIRLGKVVSEFSNMNLEEFGEDIVGRTYEYFLGEFFKKQGQKGGEFYTPKNIVNLMVQIIDPKEGKIYDPAAGTGGMLVQARKHIIEKGGNPDKLVPYGQEFQNKTWKLSRINLLIHGFYAESMYLGAKSADTFTDDQHRGKKFDYILANPPFNIKNWGLEHLDDSDPRWKWGIPPKNNANYAWISHMIYKLENNGIGATILANGSLSGVGKNEYEIRKQFVNEGVIKAIIALPAKLFYTVQIPACIWVFSKQKVDKMLMIDASQFEGEMISKKLRILTNDDISKISKTFKAHMKNQNINEIGFAKSVTKQEIIDNDYSFVPGRYVGFVEEQIDKEKIREEIKKSAKELHILFNEVVKLVPKIEDSINKAINFKEIDKENSK